jgi:hypothetical protein
MTSPTSLLLPLSESSSVWTLLQRRLQLLAPRLPRPQDTGFRLRANQVLQAGRPPPCLRMQTFQSGDPPQALLILLSPAPCFTKRFQTGVKILVGGRALVHPLLEHPHLAHLLLEHLRLENQVSVRVHLLHSLVSVRAWE